MKTAEKGAAKGAEWVTVSEPKNSRKNRFCGSKEKSKEFH